MEKCTFDIDKDTCFALVEKKCEGCSFCKTTRQLNLGRTKAIERLLSTPGGYKLIEKYDKGLPRSADQ